MSLGFAFISDYGKRMIFLHIENLFRSIAVIDRVFRVMGTALTLPVTAIFNLMSCPISAGYFPYAYNSAILAVP